MQKTSRVPFGFFDEVRESVPPSNRTDVIEITEGENAPFDLRHFTLFTPLLVDGSINQIDFDVCGAVILALYHFNNGIADVVPNIEDVGANCDLKFSLDIIDSRYSPMKSSRELLNDVLKRASEDNPANPFPTAIIGAARSAVSSPLGILSGLHGIPQISYASTSAVFDDKAQFPLFGRLVPSVNGDARVVVEYLQKNMGVTHVGILYVRDAYGSSYAQAMQSAATALEQPMKVFLSSFAYDGDPREIKAAVRELALLDLRYFFGIFFSEDYANVMTEAHRCGIAGSGRFWLLADGLEDIPLKTFKKSQTALVEATHGAALITPAHTSTLLGTPAFDKFLNHWQHLLVPEVRSYIRSKMPSDLVHAQNGTILEQTKFSDLPGPFAALSYDTVIALAFAACEAGKQDKYFDGHALFNEFLNISFNGLFGKVAVDHLTGTRRVDSQTGIPYTISNILSKGPDENGVISFSNHPTDIFANGNGQYANNGWQNIVDFIYSDSTTNPPPPLPPLQHNPNLIGTAGHIAGLVLCGMVCVLSMFFSWWTWKNQSSRVVKASQPFFLLVLTGGTFLISCTIIPMGMEEPLSQRHLDMSCQAIPWLFSTGFAITFSALFAKTLRINRIIHHEDLQRITLKPHHVAKPAALLLAVNTIILSVWTAIAPLQYERFYGSTVDRYGRPTESFAMCILPTDNRGVSVFMLSLLICSNVVTLVFALHQVWKARDIDTEYSESRFVALAMISLLQVFLIGIPLFFVVKTSPLAWYIVFSAIIFLMCVTILLLIFIPKMLFHREWKQIQIKRQLRREQLEMPSWLLLSKTTVSARNLEALDLAYEGALGQERKGESQDKDKQRKVEGVTKESNSTELSLDVGEQLICKRNIRPVKNIDVPVRMPMHVVSV